MRKIIFTCLTVLMLLFLTSCGLDHSFNAPGASKNKATVDTDKGDTVEYVVKERNGIEYYYYLYGDACVMRAMNVTENYKGMTASLPDKTPEGLDVTGYHVNSFYSTLPAMLTVEEYERLAKKFTYHDKQLFISFYSLKDVKAHLEKISDPEKQKTEAEAFLEKYPITAMAPVYVFNGATPKEYRAAEDLLKSIGFTYEDHLQVSNELLKIAKGNRAALESIDIPSRLLNIENDEQFLIPSEPTELTLRFSNAPKLKSIYVPETVEGGEFVFHGCGSLKSFVFPNSTETVANDAFDGCVSLESVTLPEGLLRIGDRAFEGCAKLMNVTVPDSVTYIGARAFAECSSITDFTFPSGVTVVESAIFDGCTALESVALHENISYVGEVAFRHCRSLDVIYYGDTAGEWRFIKKGLDWCVDAGSFIVKCTDIDVSEGSVYDTYN